MKLRSMMTACVLALGAQAAVAAALKVTGDLVTFTAQ